MPLRITPRLGEWCVLGAILLLGTFLRLYQLEYKSLWVDEIGQVVVAQGSLADAVRGAADDVAAPPLDYIVTWVMLRISNNEFVLRFAPAVWSILAMPVLFVLSKRLTRSRVTALAATYLFALAPLVVRYGQEARFYSLSILLTLVTVYAFVRAWEDPKRWRWGFFTAAVVAGFFAHYYIGLVVGALVIWSVLMRREWTRERLMGLGAAVLVFTVIAGVWFVWVGRGDPTLYTFTLPELDDVVGNPVTGVNVDAGWRRVLDALGLVILPICALIGLAALVWTQRKWALLLALILAIGVMGVLAGDWLLHYFYTPRQLLFLVPYYLILVAVGIVAACEFLLRSRREWRRVAVGAVLAGITVVFALSLRGYYDWVKDDWRSAARLLENAWAARVVTEPASLGTYLVYYRPSLEQAFEPNDAERVWIVTLDVNKPQALEQNQWKSIRLDASPTLNIFYAGDASETELWREAAQFDLPPQVIAYSDVLGKVHEIDPLLAETLAERVRQEMMNATPPLLDSQQARLLRKLKRLE